VIVPAAEPLRVREESERKPDVTLRQPHAGRQHTHDGVAEVVEHQRLANGRRITGELLLPEGVRDDHDPLSANLVVPGFEHAPERRLHA
jgi:hypothetical protein